MKILLTNDDGVDAEGLDALFRSVSHALDAELGDRDYEIIVVAPDRCRSECGHSLETRHALSLKTIRPGWHSLNGTPVDCIRVAVYAMGLRPDMVFSGINAGANLGVNLMVSGTFAAAREASLLGIPALAASHYRRPDVPRTWDHTPSWLSETIGDFVNTIDGRDKSQYETAPLWNVNLPAIEPRVDSIPVRVHCSVDRCPIDRSGLVEPGGRIQFDLDFHGRARENDSDVAHCFDGKITLSAIDPHTGR